MVALLACLPLLAACGQPVEHFKQAPRTAPAELTAPCVKPAPRPVAAKEDAEIVVWAADAERRALECERTHAKLVQWLTAPPPPDR